MYKEITLLHSRKTKNPIKNWTKDLNRPITANRIEAVIKKLPANKSPGPDTFKGEFYKTLKK